MITVLSPAKLMDERAVEPLAEPSTPVFLKESNELAKQLAACTTRQIGELMAVNTDLALLNAGRYRNWSQATVKPAALLYNGQVYKGLGAATWDADDIRFAQQYVRLFSGLYGLLRPMDGIKPHRLEMLSRLAVGRQRATLYDFWSDRVTRELGRILKETRSRVLVNLASDEYIRNVDTKALKVRVVKPVFKERTSRGTRMVIMHAKYQRGAMARWIIRRRLLDPDGLKGYDRDGYRYEPGESNADEWVFLR